MKNIILLIFLPLFSFSQQKTMWDLHIQNDLNEWIPVRMYFDSLPENATKIETAINIVNATETIHLEPFKINNDTTYYRFVDYNAELALTLKNYYNIDTAIVGYWVNYESEPVKKRAVKAHLKYSPVDEGINRYYNANGNWKTKIIRKTNESDAILMINQRKRVLHATIRTKAGDYRFLEGKITGVGFYLSSFSGNSVYYIRGKIINDTLKATLSGLKTNDVRLEAVKDDTYELPDAKSLTNVINDKPFNLNLKDELGKPIDFAKLTKNKVSIVSIFGTWCPNCVDEINYFNELQKKFPNVQIVCTAFENSDNETERQKRIQGFKQRKNISIQFLIAEKPTTENVFKHFPMIDKFGGYPTSFLIDKKGKIVEIYTGFNGPATGTYYDLFKEELEKKLRELDR